MGKVTVPMGPAPPHSPAQRPRTFVPLQDILVGLEVLLLLHVHVGGGGQVPRHARVRGAGRARGPATRVEASATPGWRISAAAGPGQRPQGRLRGSGGRWLGAASLQTLRPGSRRCGGARCPAGMRRASAASPGCAADARPGGGAAALGSGTALRPAHRPPPVPERLLFGTHNRCRGNKAPGPVSTEGAGGWLSTPGRGVVGHANTFPSPS